MRIELLIFLVLLAIILLFHIVRGQSNKEKSTKKDSDKTKPEKKGAVEKIEKVFGEGSLWSIILVAIGYILLVYAIRTVFPDFWVLWWGDQPLFWISTVGFLIGAGLLLLPGGLSLPGKSIGVLLILVLIVGISRHITETIPEEEKAEQAISGVRVVHRIPSNTLNRDGWHLAVEKEPGFEFCPPGGTDTDVVVTDPTIGITYKLKRPNGMWGSVYRSPFKEDVELGLFICMRLSGDRNTVVLVKIKPSA